MIYCKSNKGECDLNQSKDGSFVIRVAKNNSWNNGLLNAAFSVTHPAEEYQIYYQVFWEQLFNFVCGKLESLY